MLLPQGKGTEIGRLAKTKHVHRRNLIAAQVVCRIKINCETFWAPLVYAVDKL